MSDSERSSKLPLPSKRCLNTAQAAEYLGIGKTLLEMLGPEPIYLGKRKVYDVVDLDFWLDEHKRRGRALEELLSWPEKEDFTGEKTHRTSGSMSSSPMDEEYAKVLDLEKKPRPRNS